MMKVLAGLKPVVNYDSTMSWLSNFSSHCQVILWSVATKKRKTWSICRIHSPVFGFSASPHKATKYMGHVTIALLPVSLIGLVFASIFRSSLSLITAIISNFIGIRLHRLVMTMQWWSHDWHASNQDLKNVIISRSLENNLLGRKRAE